MKLFSPEKRRPGRDLVKCMYMCGVGMKKTEPDSSQWYPAKGQEEMGIN